MSEYNINALGKNAFLMLAAATKRNIENVDTYR